MSIDTIVKELEVASLQISEEQVEKMIKLIEGHKRIFVYGTGRSGLMLKAFAMRLMQLGYNSYVVGETTTPSVQKGDLLVVASASGETQSVCNAADSAKVQGVDVAVITSSNKSTLSSNHEAIITIDAATKFSTSKSSIQPLGSLFEQMLLIVFDTVILKMSEIDAESNNDMAARHASIE
ncbi:6-phospho-3-hexuloisomerase [Intestinibacter sp.]|uniref:6-phospho-3-hexuloisomerase n=1 Tax=Intestinibacter sp. TaxID=1965304 RepID=UPI003F14424F